MSFACSTAHSAIRYASQHHRGELLLPLPNSEVTDDGPNGRGEVPRAIETRKGLKPPKAHKLGRFELLVRRYYAGVYSVAPRLTNEPVEAVLLTHGAFLSRRRQLLSRRDEVRIVTILLTAVIPATRIATLEGANRKTRVHANEPITKRKRADCQRCSLRCPICSAAERARAVESERCASMDSHSRAGVTVFTMIETR